jgi:hypothetical protein
VRLAEVGTPSVRRISQRGSSPNGLIVASTVKGSTMSAVRTENCAAMDGRLQRYLVTEARLGQRLNSTDCVEKLVV